MSGRGGVRSSARLSGDAVAATTTATPGAPAAHGPTVRVPVGRGRPVATTAAAALRRARAAERAREVEDSPRVLRDKCRRLARALRNAKHLVVYTGAGISTAADIPDYRGPDGVWTRLQRGETVGRVEVSRARPTFTHMALTALWARGALKFVVSQNCDGLHLRAGLPRRALAELHGDMFAELCAPCRRVYLRAFDTTERTARHQHGTRRLCHACGAELRDSIVHFGERGRAAWPLNWAGALRHAARADVVLCLGSSLKVLRRYPRLWRMQSAPRARPALYIVNLQWTPKDSVAALKINARCDAVMQQVARRLRLRVPRYRAGRDPVLAHAEPLAAAELHTTRRPLLRAPAEPEDSGSDEWEPSSPSASDSDEELPLRHLADRLRGPSPDQQMSDSDRRSASASDRPCGPTSDRPRGPACERPWASGCDRLQGFIPNHRNRIEHSRPASFIGDRLWGPVPNRVRGPIPDHLHEHVPERFRGAAPVHLQGLAPERLRGPVPNRVRGPHPEQHRGTEPGCLQGLALERLRGPIPGHPRGTVPSRPRRRVPDLLRRPILNRFHRPLTDGFRGSDPVRLTSPAPDTICAPTQERLREPVTEPCGSLPELHREPTVDHEHASNPIETDGSTVDPMRGSPPDRQQNSTPDPLRSFQVCLHAGEATIMLRAEHAPSPPPGPSLPRCRTTDLRRFRIARRANDSRLLGCDSISPGADPDPNAPNHHVLDPDSCPSAFRQRLLAPDPRPCGPESSLLRPDPRPLSPETRLLDPDLQRLKPDPRQPEPDLGVRAPESHPIDHDAGSVGTGSCSLGLESGPLDDDPRPPTVNGCGGAHEEARISSVSLPDDAKMAHVNGTAGFGSRLRRLLEYEPRIDAGGNAKRRAADSGPRAVNAVKTEVKTEPKVEPKSELKPDLKEGIKREASSSDEELGVLAARSLAAAFFRRAVLLCRASLYPGLHTIIAAPAPAPRAAPPRVVAGAECAWCARHYSARRCLWYGPPRDPPPSARAWRRVRGRRYLCACCGASQSPPRQPDPGPDEGGWYGKGYRKGRRPRRR